MDNLVDLGVGAAVVLLILDRVFAFLKSQSGRRNGSNDKAGEKPVAEWEQRIERVVERVVENKIAPRLGTVEGLLADLKQSLMVLIRWKGGD